MRSGSLSSNAAKISLQVLAHDVGEHVEAPAVGHAEHDLLDARARRRRSIEQIEQRDQALGALEREALRADVVRVDELLEDLRVGELA